VIVSDSVFGMLWRRLWETREAAGDETDCLRMHERLAFCFVRGLLVEKDMLDMHLGC
jgi:hypothetical protein